MASVQAVRQHYGEDAFLDIVKRYDEGKDFSDIRGLWWKNSSGEVVKNADRPSTKDMTSYPWPDRRRTDYASYYLPGTKQPMVTTAITSRGCPHSCPFCLTYKKQYRIRAIDNILDEIEDCISIGIVSTISFVQDLILADLSGLSALFPAVSSVFRARRRTFLHIPEES